MFGHRILIRILLKCTRDVSCSRFQPMSSDDSGEPIDPIRFQEVAARGFCLWDAWDRQATFERHLAAQRPLASLLAPGGADTLVCAERSLHKPGGSSGSHEPALPSAAIPLARPLQQSAPTVTACVASEATVIATTPEGRDPIPATRPASDIVSEGSDNDIIVSNSRNGRKKRQFGQRGGGEQSQRAKASASQSVTVPGGIGSRRDSDEANAAQTWWRKRRKKTKW